MNKTPCSVEIIAPRGVEGSGAEKHHRGFITLRAAATAACAIRFDAA